MQKILLSLSLFCTVYTASSQVLASNDFSSYTVGNIGTDNTGMNPGQGGWLTAGAANSDFQIVDNGALHGKVLQITGSATATGNKYMWTDFTDTWLFRDAGNNILSIEYDYYTGPATASKNAHRLCVFNADRTKILGGLLFTEDTKVLSGLSYYNNAGTYGNYSFNPTSGAVILPADTWVRMGFSFNKTTGQVICKTSGLATNLNMTITGAGSGVDPTEMDIVAGAGTANTASTLGLYDNYLARASSTAVLLGVERLNTLTSFTVFPNPANNVLNVSAKNNATITNITFTDLNGRIVKEVSYLNVSEVHADISELSAGVYLMNILTSDGKATKKILKN